MQASLTKPSETSTPTIEYVRKIASSQDQTTQPEWGDGELIYLTIRVSDTGRGLSSAEKSNLFTLFQQASPKTHVQYGGSGLGLFISRQLAEMQGGEIGVASEPEKGSTFEFYVKARRIPALAHNEDVAKAVNVQNLAHGDALREACGEISSVHNDVPISNGVAIAPLPLPHRPAPQKSLHILVVEDNLVNQNVVTKQLRKAGHVVSVANHGVEAIEFLQTTKYWHPPLLDGATSSCDAEPLDVVLMDLEMPIMDGLSCVRRVREYQRDGLIRGHVPVIAVTANARRDQIAMYLEEGMVSFSSLFCGMGGKGKANWIVG